MCFLFLGLHVISAIQVTVATNKITCNLITEVKTETVGTLITLIPLITLLTMVNTVSVTILIP